MLGSPLSARLAAMNVQVHVVGRWPTEDIIAAEHILTDGQLRGRLTVKRESIVDTSCPCVVSAGQSFGMMNGGVDGVINTFLSSHTPHEYVQERVKRAIAEHCAGELGVGQAVSVEVAHPRVRALVYAATMRVPEPVPDTLNAYAAFRAALVEAAKLGVSSVATPLMCTGAGEMPLLRACRQMRAAYDSVLEGGDVGAGFREVHRNHRELIKSCFA